ncbi:MAG: MBL fold metallo-hydrolase, partial [Candidatus Diapherotrites archaeon]|nr:MBL fold metallo-hydrolase [Candidatus Diapherotrites archaeon]
MGKIKVTLLGTSAAVPSKHRNLSGTVLNFDGENFLFDCGEGTQKQLMLSGNSFMKVNNVFVSHFHADHWLGLVGLIATMGLMQRQQKLKIFGPKGIKERVLTILPQFNLAPQFEIEFKELREGKILEGKNFEISTFKLKHSVTSYGFVFQEHGKVGEFQRQKALDLGIPIGPLFAKLASGETVEVDGKKIKPEQVMDYSKSKLGKKIS